MRNFIGLVYITIMGIILMASCNNTSNNTSGQGQDNAGNTQNMQGITIKERQHFHTYAQRTIDSVQHLVDNMDNKVRKQELVLNSNWIGARDSVRKILDHANRSLNNQSYHSDDEWNNYKSSIQVAIDSAETVWKKGTTSLKTININTNNSTN